MSDLIKFEAENAMPAELKYQLELDSQENMEGVKPVLPKIIMPTGNSKEFTVEQQSEDEIQTKNLVGIILYQSAANAYWQESFGVGDAVVPDCASHDGITPSSQYDDVQSETCASCRHNRFGSAKDDAGNKLPGKACRNVKRVVLLRPDDDSMPCILTVPPSSIKSFDEYMVFLRKKKRPYYTVATELSLETQTNKKGIKYPEIQFKTIGYINDVVIIKSLMDKRKEWRDLIENTLFISTDTTGEDDSMHVKNASSSDEF